MPFGDEIPNSQPSSPALSSSPVHSPVKSAIYDASHDPSMKLVEADPPPTDVAEDQSLSNHEHTTKPPLTDSNTSLSSSPHKTLSATLPKSVPHLRRPLRPATSSSSHSPAYLRERINLLRTSLVSTHTQLTSSLAELQLLLPQETSATTSAHPPASDELPPTPIPNQQQQQQNQHQTLTSLERQTLLQAASILQNHVTQLGKYNAVKDIAMGMLGIIAEREGRTLRDVMTRRDISEDD